MAEQICPTCGGAGSINQKVTSGEGDNILVETMYLTCQTCWGTGKLGVVGVDSSNPEVNRIATANKVITGGM